VRKLLLIATFSFLGLVLSTTAVEAAILNKNLSRTYDFRGDYIQVTETLNSELTSRQYLIPAGSEEAFVIFNPLLNDKQAKQKLDHALKTLQVTNGNGQKLNFRTEIKDQNAFVYVAYPQALRTGARQVFQISYQSTALSTKVGAIYDFYIPSFAKDYKFASGNSELFVNTQVNIPTQYGELNFVTPEVSIQSKNNAYQFSFTREQLTGKVAWIQIGTTQYYEFNIRQPFNATAATGLYSNTYDILLPRSIQSGPLNQEVFYTEITPQPHSITTDSDGNLVGRFKVPANQSGEVVLKGYASIKVNRQFDEQNSGKLADIPAELVTSATSAAQYWETAATPIQQAAQGLKGDQTDVYKLMIDTYRYVVNRIDYSDVKRFGINERQGALKTLAGGAAVCMEYSDLFIALMRAQGVPTRAAFGYGYDVRTTNGVDTPHQWAEVYLPKHNTWLLVDTTWGESGSPVIGADLNHFYKYVATASPVKPAPVQVKYVGELSNVATEQFTIKALDKLPNLNAVAAVDLPSRYPQANQTALDTLQEGAVLILASIDNVITAVLTKLNLNPTAISLIKVVVVGLLILVLLAGVVLLLLRLRSQYKKGKSIVLAPSNVGA
jgi:transglutaminase-like putative cysteine protease